MMTAPGMNIMTMAPATTIKERPVGAAETAVSKMNNPDLKGQQIKMLSLFCIQIINSLYRSFLC